MEIKQILYINKTKFVCDTVEKICKTASIDCYTLEDCNDFAYLINDLRPLAVIIEDETYNLNRDAFWSQFEESELKPVSVIMGEDIEQKFDLIMDLPLDMQTFTTELKSKLAENLKND